MSKSRHNHKWFDDEEDEDFHMGRNRAKHKNDRDNNVKLEERRQQRRLVHEAKTKNLNYYEGAEET